MEIILAQYIRGLEVVILNVQCEVRFHGSNSHLSCMECHDSDLICRWNFEARQKP